MSIDSFFYDYYTTKEHPTFKEGLRISKSLERPLWAIKFNQRSLTPSGRFKKEKKKRSLTEYTLKRWVRNGWAEVKYNRLGPIVEFVCKNENLTKKELCGLNLNREITAKKQIFCYLASMRTKETRKRIGVLTGIKSHASVTRSIKIVMDRMSIDSNFETKINKYLSDLCFILKIFTTTN